ncbi:hypothetical protein DSO57_1024868 [Entomophthora muscae]|uniref:Uncharacterized protein n=1 Tax=Entomophthora muscae TaxID=34485 RepID=A0ACC2S4H1_9FUNG|nr:hypothetical protein DSO57_1024868 [Entomophthora muscae]
MYLVRAVVEQENIRAGQLVMYCQDTKSNVELQQVREEWKQVGKGLPSHSPRSSRWQVRVNQSRERQVKHSQELTTLASGIRSGGVEMVGLGVGGVKLRLPLRPPLQFLPNA